MKKLIRVSPLADSDIDNYANYIAKDDVNAALRFFDEVQFAYEKIAEFPAIGSLRYSHIHLLNNVRVWAISKFDSHIIFYVERENHIDVIRVLHSSMDIPSLFNDME